MSDVIISPNMSLPVPIVSQDPGPDWANNYNSCLSILDMHNHASGSGIQITQDGISLTASASTFDSLSFNGSNPYAVRSLRFTPQAAALALATDVGCIYEAGVDLYYNDGSGNQIRLTQGGSIVGTSGSITGLPSGTASASFSSGTFVWQSATNTAANMDAGSYVFRNSTASSKGLTLNPPNAMAADYSLYLPALPGAQKIMTLDASGNMSAPYTVDNSTIVISSNVIGVPASGIGTTQIAASAVTTAKIADANVTTAKIADSNVTTPKIADANVTLAKLAAVNRVQTSSSGSYVNNTASFALITNQTATITTTVATSRILITIQPIGTLASYISATANGVAGNFGFQLKLLTGLVTLALWEGQDWSVNASQELKCPSAFTFISNVLNIETNVFTLQLVRTGQAQSARALNITMIAEEIPG